jgi:hypothetical protein
VSRRVYENDDDLLETRNTYFNAPGPDAVFGTADDVINGYSTSAYAGSGARTDYKSYGTAGPDAVWNTADDRLSTDLDHNSTL